MKTARTAKAARAALVSAPRPIVLVPTMGALHEGHAELIQRARKAAGEGTVVVSIYVNPAQFAPGEDFERYPRSFDSDAALCRKEHADLIFHPENLYAPDASVRIIEEKLSEGLCGPFRPGHFNGVCIAVAKLFNILSPDIAVFGEKDWQQLAILRRLVADLDFPVKLVPVPTVRESDGLAMSSRNAYLTPEEREQAVSLIHSLRFARDAVKGGEISAVRIVAGMRALLRREAPLSEIQYATIADAETLSPLRTISKGARAFVAVRLGSTRLIDNMAIA